MRLKYVILCVCVCVCVCIWTQLYDLWGFLCVSDGKESTCNAGGLDSIPGLGRSHGEGNGNPLQYPCLENLMDRGAWWAAVHGVAKSWTRLRLTHTHNMYIPWRKKICYFLSKVHILPLESAHTSMYHLWNCLVVSCLLMALLCETFLPIVPYRITLAIVGTQ